MTCVLNSAVHHPRDLPCVHILTPPPRVLRVSAKAVAALNFQPRYCPPPAPCIASRRGDVLIVAFHTEGPTFNVSHGNRAVLRWYYRLTESADPDVWLGHKISE